MNRPQWHDAAAFAARAHRHQIRKDGSTPYAAHVSRVAMVLATEFGVNDDDLLSTAYLHDVIEDCDVDYDDIAEQFGEMVASYVAALSKDTRLPEPEREAAYDAQLAAAPWPVRLVKIADVCDNLRDAVPAGRARLLALADRVLVMTENDAECARAREVLRGIKGIVGASGGSNPGGGSPSGDASVQQGGCP